MQKTQVIKLNTSNDNVQNFFDKMKTKFLQHQAKGGDLQNFDITMIVKHQGTKKSIQQINSNSNVIQKNQTQKSILTQNSHNFNKQQKEKESLNKSNSREKSNSKQKLKIYDEQMRLQSRILPTDPSLNLEKQNQQSSKLSSKRKVRESNKIPSISSLFQFNKKKDQIMQENLKFKSQKNNISIVSSDRKQVDFQEKFNQEGDSSESQISQNSQVQQLEEEQLKKHVSRRHIDIFPNIEITGVVSEKMFSLKHVQNQDCKHSLTKNHKRRCSITNEDLLSPRLKSKFTEQKLYSAKIYTHGLSKHKSQNFIKSEKKVIAKDTAKEKGRTQKQDTENIQKNKRTSLQINEVNEQQSVLEDKSMINKMKDKCRNAPNDNHRYSSLAKQSIFNQNQQSVNTVDKKTASFCLQNPGAAEYNIKINSQNQIFANPQICPIPDESQNGSQQEQKSQASSNQQAEDSIYVIQNKLNDCIKLLQKNELSNLQDFLYEFKDKYFYVSNTRIQIKWRLMMAHCKQNKKQYERAAINYNNVIDLAKQNPKSLIIQPAEVYHRLGVCYSQIGWWNKGILAFTQALNRYKRSKNPTKYGQCMNNLGTLYLQAKSISSAQKCFIQSYNLNKSLHGKHSTKLLTSLFNIFQCNLLMKNYDQAQKIIEVIEQEIISKISESQSNHYLYIGGLFRRKGKMEYLRGHIKNAEQYYLQAFQKLSHKYPYCMQFGELMSCLGLLKLQDRKYKQSKNYYDKAIMLMNFYCSKDSRTILTLKKNLQYSVKMVREEKQGWSSRRQTSGQL